MICQNEESANMHLVLLLPLSPTFLRPMLFPIVDDHQRGKSSRVFSARRSANCHRPRHRACMHGPESTADREIFRGGGDGRYVWEPSMISTTRCIDRSSACTRRVHASDGGFLEMVSSNCLERGESWSNNGASSSLWWALWLKLILHRDRLCEKVRLDADTLAQIEVSEYRVC